jgi:hypothetical protein
VSVALVLFIETNHSSGPGPGNPDEELMAEE